MSDRRVVITGLGAATCLGLSAGETWEALCRGESGIDTIESFDPVGFTCKIAGEVPEFKVRKFVPKSHRKAVKLMSRDIEISVVAAADALDDAGIITKGIDPEKINVEPDRFAINIGAGLISCDLVELAPAVAASAVEGKYDLKKWGTDGLPLVTPLWLLKYLPNMLACHIGIIHDIQGPSNTMTCAEASGQIAIGEAARTIQRGSADLALAGGAEAKVNPIVMIRQCLIKRATAEGNDSPSTACRPFDADAKGCVFGEGAGIIILESAENAENRGARVYAEFAGFGQSNNLSPDFTKLEPDGAGIRIAIEKALADAGITAAEIDLVIPHGTSIPADDLAEARAIETALGDSASQIPVWPTKSMLSNTGAGAGAIDVLAGAKAIFESKIPAAVNCDKVAEGCNLNIVKSPVEKKLRNVLCISYTYGGQTTATVLRNPAP